MIVYTLVGWIYFGKGFTSFPTRAFTFLRDTDTMKSIIGLGMSSLIMTLMSLVQGVVVFNAMSRYGTVSDIAFYGVVYRVFTFFLTPIFGLMRALQPVIGINFGAGEHERVIRSYKIFTVAAMLLTLPFWIVSMLTPDLILGLMLPDQSFTGSEILYYWDLYVHPAALIGIARQLIFYVPVCCS